MQEKESIGCLVRIENSVTQVTVALVTKFSIRTSQPLKYSYNPNSEVEDKQTLSMINY